MIEVFQRLDGPHELEPDYRLLLTQGQRCRARLKTQTICGKDVGIFLPHGQPLVIGEYLQSSCGKTLMIEGATEQVMSASCEDPLLFARACYHLGNRHVKIQITENTLIITPDSVLEKMLHGLGLKVQEESAVFVPENGAYHSHKHQHERLQANAISNKSMDSLQVKEIRALND